MHICTHTLTYETHKLSKEKKKRDESYPTLGETTTNSLSHYWGVIDRGYLARDNERWAEYEGKVVPYAVCVALEIELCV